MCLALADAGFAVFGFVLVVVLAGVVAVVGAIGLVFKVFFAVFGRLYRGVFGGPRAARPLGRPVDICCPPAGVHERSPRVCENGQCGQQNPAHAVFCGRCGLPLRR